MRRERAQRTQVQFAPSQVLVRLRKSSTHARCRHSPPSRAFTHSQGFHAVRKQRRKSQLQMQQALLELHEVCEQLCEQHVALPSQLRQSRQELRIPQSHQSILVAHHSSLAREISSPALGRCVLFRRENGFECDLATETVASRNLVRATTKSNSHPLDEAARCRELVKEIIDPTAESARAERTGDARSSALVVHAPHHVCANHLRARTQAAEAPRSSKHSLSGEPGKHTFYDATARTSPAQATPPGGVKNETRIMPGNLGFID